MDEEMVPSIEYIDNPRKTIQSLKDSGVTLRVHPSPTYIRVYAKIIHDSLSSLNPEMIPKSRRDKGISVAFVKIAPERENQILTFYWNKYSLKKTSKLEELGVFLGIFKSRLVKPEMFSFGYSKDCMNFSFSDGMQYNLYSKIKDIPSLDLFSEHSKVYDLSEFGW